MDSSQFGKFNSGVAKKLNSYFNDRAPAMVVRETLRFINANFQKQGWQGATFQPWKKNIKGTRILFKSGDLMRGFNYELKGNGEILFYNNIKYARVHNEGFNGQVTVPAHTRSRYLKVKSSLTKIGKSKVREFTRTMKIDQRQFAPTQTSPSPILEADIVKWLTKDIAVIFNS
ncbi:hypothetical protein [uncultured Mucilaginibacter sp.]|uniref:hypothetical protein n=1 Tax=uncultured Mucilaginibacter sp. TaxID=797541 RepID=UPI0025DE21F7|nr:hypothetical protein [uncultured Mucilaginibacter sp.]